MEFAILGPLEAGDGGRRLTLGGPKQRAVLAMLLLDANRPVSRDRLIDGVWGESPPPSAAHTLDDYISRLRRALGGGRIERRPAGYLIRVEPGELDLECFEELLEEGRTAAAAGEAARASVVLGEALDLWRGHALADLENEPFAVSESARLEERRLLALEGRIDAELQLGRGAELAGELERLVSEHPFEQRLLGQLMLSLYRAHRPADALAAYQSFRRRFAEEVGLEPSPELRALERRILEQDATLGPAAAAPTVTSSRRSTRPRLLAGAVVLAAVVASAIVGVELGIGGSSARSTSSSRPGKTATSSLDGKTVLPQRTRWVVHPDVPRSSVREVDYIIDGKLRWVEHSPPYYFGGDDNGANAGYLITTWLSAGEHVFTSQVLSAGGKVATDVVTARVLPAPQPPAALAGTWTRTVTKQDQAKSTPTFGAGVGNVPPAGVWRLVFDRTGVWELDPVKTGLVTEYDVVADALFAYAPISMAPCSDSGPCGVTRFGHHHIGGRDCNLAGPFGSYRWSVSGARLTLTAIHEPCGQRRAIWEGAWTRDR